MCVRFFSRFCIFVIIVVVFVGVVVEFVVFVVYTLTHSKAASRVGLWSVPPK